MPGVPAIPLTCICMHGAPTPPLMSAVPALDVLLMTALGPRPPACVGTTFSTVHWQGDIVHGPVNPVMPTAVSPRVIAGKVPGPMCGMGTFISCGGYATGPIAETVFVGIA